MTKSNAKAVLILLVCMSGIRTVPGCAAEPVPPETVPNGGFEQKTTEWGINDQMSSISTEQAASGKYSLKIVDADSKTGSDVTSARIPVSPGVMVLRGKVFTVSGSRLGIYLRFLDQQGNQISADGDTLQRTLPASPANQWVPFDLTGFARKGTAYAQIWIHSYNDAQVVAYVDDLSLAPGAKEDLTPPWTGTYKIKPAEKAKLTAADVVGPDGVVYPDFRYAGIPGGIPKVKTVAKIEDFGGRANDDLDDSAALEKGAEAVGRRGGGALLLGEGTYDLDQPVMIKRDNVIIRGLGADKTKVYFRLGPPRDGARFIFPKPGQVIDANTPIEAHVTPGEIKSLEIQVDGQQVVFRDKNFTANASFSVGTMGSDVLARVENKDGRHDLTVIATYADGKTNRATAAFQFTSKPPSEPVRTPRYLAAINFVGVNKTGDPILLARDGRRGDKSLLLEKIGGLKVGSRIVLLAPATPRWNALVKNAAHWGDYRRYHFIITGIKGNEIQLNQPLRLDYPVVDGSNVFEIFPIRRCGVEDFYLEQTQNLWTSGVVFSTAWECWAKGMKVKQAGRFALYPVNAKWCEIRDCVVDDAWIKGGGGTGYVGFEYACDNLMENVTTFNVRHGPLVQWSAAGNVFTRCTFNQSDAQWHAGWTNENLFEQCVITSAYGNGGYGYGMISTEPSDWQHGPNGPRNVVYNCDVSSPKAGVSMGGMNENWLFLHNRFTVESGPGVIGKTASFDHIFKNNVFILKDPKQPGFFAKTADCIGWELIGNTILGGNGQLMEGLVEPAVNQDNRVLPLGDAPRPKPEVPSIFDWQRKLK